MANYNRFQQYGNLITVNTNNVVSNNCKMKEIDNCLKVPNLKQQKQENIDHAKSEVQRVSCHSTNPNLIVVNLNNTSNLKKSVIDITDENEVVEETNKIIVKLNDMSNSNSSIIDFTDENQVFEQTKQYNKLPFPPSHPEKEFSLHLVNKDYYTDPRFDTSIAFKEAECPMEKTFTPNNLIEVELLTEDDMVREKFYEDMNSLELDSTPEINIDYILNDIDVDEIVKALYECNMPVQSNNNAEVIDISDDSEEEQFDRLNLENNENLNIDNCSKTSKNYHVEEKLITTMPSPELTANAKIGLENKNETLNKELEVDEGKCNDKMGSSFFLHQHNRKRKKEKHSEEKNKLNTLRVKLVRLETSIENVNVKNSKRSKARENMDETKTNSKLKLGNKTDIITTSIIRDKTRYEELNNTKSTNLDKAHKNNKNSEIKKSISKRTEKNIGESKSEKIFSRCEIIDTQSSLTNTNDDFTGNKNKIKTTKISKISKDKHLRCERDIKKEEVQVSRSLKNLKPDKKTEGNNEHKKIETLKHGAIINSKLLIKNYIIPKIKKNHLIDDCEKNITKNIDDSRTFPKASSDENISFKQTKACHDEKVKTATEQVLFQDPGLKSFKRKAEVCTMNSKRARFEHLDGNINTQFETSANNLTKELPMTEKLLDDEHSMKTSVYCELSLIKQEISKIIKQKTISALPSIKKTKKIETEAVKKHKKSSISERKQKVVIEQNKIKCNKTSAFPGTLKLKKTLTKPNTKEKTKQSSGLSTCVSGEKLKKNVKGEIIARQKIHTHKIAKLSSTSTNSTNEFKSGSSSKVSNKIQERESIAQSKEMVFSHSQKHFLSLKSHMDKNLTDVSNVELKPNEDPEIERQNISEKVVATKEKKNFCSADKTSNKLFKSENEVKPSNEDKSKNVDVCVDVTVKDRNQFTLKNISKTEAKLLRESSIENEKIENYFAGPHKELRNQGKQLYGDDIISRKSRKTEVLISQSSCTSDMHSKFKNNKSAPIVYQEHLNCTNKKNVTESFNNVAYNEENIAFKKQQPLTNQQYKGQKKLFHKNLIIDINSHKENEKEDINLKLSLLKKQYSEKKISKDCFITKVNQTKQVMHGITDIIEKTTRNDNLSNMERDKISCTALKKPCRCKISTSNCLFVETKNTKKKDNTISEMNTNKSLSTEKTKYCKRKQNNIPEKSHNIKREQVKSIEVNVKKRLRNEVQNKDVITSEIISATNNSIHPLYEHSVVEKEQTQLESKKTKCSKIEQNNIARQSHSTKIEMEKSAEEVNPNKSPSQENIQNKDVKTSEIINKTNKPRYNYSLSEQSVVEKEQTQLELKRELKNSKYCQKGQDHIPEKSHNTKREKERHIEEVKAKNSPSNEVKNKDVNNREIMSTTIKKSSYIAPLSEHSVVEREQTHLLESNITKCTIREQTNIARQTHSMKIEMEKSAEDVNPDKSLGQVVQNKDIKTPQIINTTNKTCYNHSLSKDSVVEKGLNNISENSYSMKKEKENSIKEVNANKSPSHNVQNKDVETSEIVNTTNNPSYNHSLSEHSVVEEKQNQSESKKTKFRNRDQNNIAELLHYTKREKEKSIEEVNAKKSPSHEVQSKDVKTQEIMCTTNISRDIHPLSKHSVLEKEYTQLESKKTECRNREQNNIARQYHSTKKIIEFNQTSEVKTTKNPNFLNEDQTKHITNNNTGALNIIEKSNNSNPRAIIHKSEETKKQERKSLRNNVILQQKQLYLTKHYLAKPYWYVYDMENILHNGFHSCIIKTRNKAANKTVAIKLLHAKFANYHENYIEILKLIKESDTKGMFHCIGIEDIIFSHSDWCIVMEYCPHNLTQFLDCLESGLNIHKVQIFSRQLMNALMLLRIQKILHRAIKPEHILVSSDGTKIKLSGFDRSIKANNAKTTFCVHPLNYLAPEILIGTESSYSADLWAAACVMYEMATNKVLFEGHQASAVIANIMLIRGNFCQETIKKGRFSHMYFEMGSNNVTLLSKTVGSSKMKSSAKMKMIDMIREVKKPKGEDEKEKINMLCSLLESMLALDPGKRYTVELAYMHPFIYQ